MHWRLACAGNGRPDPAPRAIVLIMLYFFKLALDRRSGHQAMQQLLACSPRPTAVIVDNHLSGVGAVRALVDGTPASELHELWQPVLLPGTTVGPRPA